MADKYVIIDVREYIEHMLEMNPNISGDCGLEKAVIYSMQYVMNISLDIHRFSEEDFITEKLNWLHIVYPELFEILTGFPINKDNYNVDTVTYYFDYLNEIFQGVFVRCRCDNQHIFTSILGYSIKAKVVEYETLL